MGIIYNTKVFLAYLIGSLILSFYIGAQNNSQNVGIGVFIFCWAFLIGTQYLMRKNVKFKRQPISSNTREYVFRRQGGTCAMCSETQLLDLHHKVPVSQGGTNHPDNLILLCPNHHAMVHRGEKCIHI